MRLAHDRTGAGEPVVLLHGISHRRQAWGRITALLDDTFELVPVDLPGHGESGDLSPERAGDVGPLADAVEEFVAGAGLGRPHVVGNSLGGLLALELAARGSARTATALSPAGFWSAGERRYARAMLWGASATMGALGDRRLGRVLSSPRGRAALTSVIVARPEELTADELVGDLAGLAHPRSSFHPLLAGLGRWGLSGPPRVPAVVGWGTKDRLLPPRQYRRLQAVAPQAEFYSLPGCGHVPMADDPRAVADLVRYTASLSTA